MEKGEGFQMRIGDDDGEAFIDKGEGNIPEEESEESWVKVKRSFGISEINPEDVKIEKERENYVSFKKGTETLGYSRILDKYARYFLQENVNAWRIEGKKKHGMNCYCFDPEGPVEKASLYINGYEQVLNEKHPIFFARKSDERKPKRYVRQMKIDD